MLSPSSASRTRTSSHPRTSRAYEQKVALAKAAPRVKCHQITMLLENQPYPHDVRVSSEARALVDAGHDVTVIAPRAPGQRAREVVDRVKVRRFRLPQTSPSVRGTACEYAVALFALQTRGLVSLLRGATVLHLHNPPDLLFPVGLVARTLGRRVIFDHHDLFPELVDAKTSARLVRRAARLAERATFAVASHVLAANESHARVAMGRGRVPADRITVVRNGPPEASIATTPRMRRGALNKPRLLYLGVLGSQDGVLALAELLVRLKKDHGLADVELTVVGDGEERSKLEGALRAANALDKTRITGLVPRESVPSYLAEADICVDPSPPTALNNHSTMVKIGEYLAAGKPVVAYELLETARTADGAARLVRPGDLAAMAKAVAELAADEGARRDLAEAALKRAQALKWEHSAEALLNVYARL